MREELLMDHRFLELTDASTAYEAQRDDIQCQNQWMREEAAVDHHFLALRDAAGAHETKGDGIQCQHQSVREGPTVEHCISCLQSHEANCDDIQCIVGSVMASQLERCMEIV